MCKLVRWIHPTKESFRAETAAEKSEREEGLPTFDTSASKVLFKRDLRIALLHLCIFIVHCFPKSHLRTRKVIRNVALKSNYVIKSNQTVLNYFIKSNQNVYN